MVSRCRVVDRQVEVVDRGEAGGCRRSGGGCLRGDDPLDRVQHPSADAVVEAAHIDLEDGRALYLGAGLRSTPSGGDPSGAGYERALVDSRNCPEAMAGSDARRLLHFVQSSSDGRFPRDKGRGCGWVGPALADEVPGNVHLKREPVMDSLWNLFCRLSDQSFFSEMIRLLPFFSISNLSSPLW